MKYNIRDNEAAFVLKKGHFVKMINAGNYHFSALCGYEVESEEMTGEVEYMDVPYEILARDKAFKESTVRCQIPDGTIGFIYIDGVLRGCTTRSEYVFWNVFEKTEVKLVSMETEEMSKKVTKLVDEK